MIAAAAQQVKGGAPQITVVGMMFGPGVQRVRVTLAAGVRRTIPLHELSQAQAREAGLRRFSYAAFVVRGAWCAERLVSLDASGGSVWNSGTDEYACTDPPPEFGA